MNKVFNTIKIFDEFTIFNCFDAALYSALYNFDCEPRYIIFNEYDHLVIDDNIFSINRELHYQLKYELENLGFEIEETVKKELVTINNIIDGIDSNSAYIMYLYEPISYEFDSKKSNFNQKRKHCFIIYGYNKQKKIFYVIDFLDIATYVYKSLYMTFDDFLTSLEKTFHVNEFYMIRLKRISNSKINLFCNINEYTDVFLDNIIKIDDFLCEFRRNILCNDNRISLFNYIKNIIFISNYLKKMEYVYKDEHFNRQFCALVNQTSKNIQLIISYSIKLFNNQKEIKHKIIEIINNNCIITRKMLDVKIL